MHVVLGQSFHAAQLTQRVEVADEGHPRVGCLPVALEERFLATEAETGSGSPRALTLVYAAGQGDGKTRGKHLTREYHRVVSVSIPRRWPQCRSERDNRADRFSRTSLGSEIGATVGNAGSARKDGPVLAAVVIP